MSIPDLYYEKALLNACRIISDTKVADFLLTAKNRCLFENAVFGFGIANYGLLLFKCLSNLMSGRFYEFKAIFA